MARKILAKKMRLILMSKTKVKKREKVRNTTKKKMRCFKMVISHAIIIYI